MDREEKLDLMAATIAAGIYTNLKAGRTMNDIGHEAVKLTLLIEREIAACMSGQRKPQTADAIRQ
jgi:hypothetical protein